MVIACLLTAQQPGAAMPAASSNTPAFSVPTSDAHLINISIVVHDKKGSLIESLSKDDFVLQVDHKPYSISSFSKGADLPLTVGLLVDTGSSQRESLDEERAASSTFLDYMLDGPAGRDKAFLAQFARQIDLLQDITSSKPNLQAGLKQLVISTSAADTASVTSVSDPRNAPDSRPTRGSGTSLYDALFLSSDELMSKQQGRKALIVIASGIDGGSKESVESAIEAAQRADTVIYAIYVKGKQTNPDRGFHTSVGQSDPGCSDGNPGGYPGSYPGGYPGGYPPGGYPGGYPDGCQGPRPQGIPVADGKKTLEHIATQTGGEMFELSKKGGLVDIYKQIAEALRAQYRLSFSLDKETASGGYHRIALSLSKAGNKDLSIQTRDGYYTGD
jgi:VWFA-related protein